MSITDPASLAGNFVFQQTQVPIDASGELLVGSNLERVAIILSNVGNTAANVNPTSAASNTAGMYLNAAGQGGSTLTFWYHDVGGLVGEPWYGWAWSSGTTTIQIIEVIYRPSA